MHILHIRASIKGRAVPAGSTTKLLTLESALDGRAPPEGRVWKEDPDAVEFAGGGFDRSSACEGVVKFAFGGDVVRLIPDRKLLVNLLWSS